MATGQFSLLTLATQKVEELTGADNWHTFKDEILLVFNADGESAKIVDGTTKKPTEAVAAADWEKKDRAAMTIIWARMHKDLNPLVKGVTSGSALYAKLKAKYEASTWSRRVTLRTAFHTVTHDTSLPVEKYVEKVTELRDQLVALGEEVSENYFKDVLLANLDPLYLPIRNTLLSQPAGESDLAAVKSVISGATYIKPDTENVKLEPEESALATRSGGGKVFASSGSGHGKSGHRNRDRAAHTSGDEGHGMDDEKGFRWCDPTHEDHCHRCGRRNHIAARCVADMPKDIKAWVLDRPGSKERSNAIHQTYVPHPSFSTHRHRPSPSFHTRPIRADYLSDD